MFCREHAVQLHGIQEKLVALGAKLHFVGSGGPHFIAGFREETGVDSPIYSDTGRDSFQAAGFKRGLRATFNPGTVARAVRAWRGGFRQGRTQGDPWQQGGVIAIAPNQELLYYYASDGAGDYPMPARDLLQAIAANAAA